MAKFAYSKPDIDCNLAHLLVDDVFDLHFLRTEAGLTIDVWERDCEQILSLSVPSPRHAEG